MRSFYRVRKAILNIPFCSCKHVHVYITMSRIILQITVILIIFYYIVIIIRQL